uniref:Uncharacterized protein n=1 Tax=Anguilla anguilla TaxID=7936 RepID=A0A0E9PD92_ANGAN
MENVLNKQFHLYSLSTSIPIQQHIPFTNG